MNPQGHSSQNILSKAKMILIIFLFFFIIIYLFILFIFFGGGGVAFNKAGEIVNLGNVIWINVLKWNVS